MDDGDGERLMVLLWCCCGGEASDMDMKTETDVDNVSRLSLIRLDSARNARAMTSALIIGQLVGIPTSPVQATNQALPSETTLITRAPTAPLHICQSKMGQFLQARLVWPRGTGRDKGGRVSGCSCRNSRFIMEALPAVAECLRQWASQSTSLLLNRALHVNTDQGPKKNKNKKKSQHW